MSSTNLWKTALLLAVIIGLGNTFLARATAYEQASVQLSSVVGDNQLPVCDNPILLKPINPAELPPPDINATTACKLQTKVSEVPADSPEAKSGRVSGSAPSAYAWATNVLSCRWSSSCSTSSPGFTEMYYNVSSQTPSLPAGKSWNDYHDYNRVHFSHPSYSGACTGYESVSAGIAYGVVLTGVWTNRIIAESLQGTCSLYDSGVTINGPGNITFHIFRSGSSWAIDAWLGSWSRIATISTTWGVAAEAEFGQELWAGNGDLGTIVAPVNFIHKAVVAGTSNSLRPWSDNVLVAPLNGRTLALPSPNSPWKVMDLFGGDFTSMSSHNIH